LNTTVLDVRRLKESKTRFAMLTAYDFLTARALDEAGVPILLVGDTLGIFVLGYETTIAVTVDDVIHHCRPVARGAKNALVVGDLPFGAYGGSRSEGIRNAVRILKEGGAQAVKLEGPFFDLVKSISDVGIPVMGHLGLTPQSIHKFGGNKVQARTEAAVDGLVDAARRLEAAGVFALVLEAVPVEAAKRVTESIGVPTIGIGAGPYCDGQVLVSSEMLGLSDGQRPRYAKLYADLHSEIVRAGKEFVEEVSTGRYPDLEHSYNWAVRA
jgi:3-methyl-2-oxobutanoate hydroxymethyltransferase